MFSSFEIACNMLRAHKGNDYITIKALCHAAGCTAAEARKALNLVGARRIGKTHKYRIKGRRVLTQNAAHDTMIVGEN